MKFTVLLTALLAFAGFNAYAEAPKPLKVLLVLGGCCHDYAKQQDILKQGIEARANATVDILYTPDKSTKAKFADYERKDWAKGYDVVIHDECSADITDPTYVANIIDAHRNGVPAVNLHCAMHCYRWGNFHSPVPAGADNSHWYEMLGLQSTGHGAQMPIALTFVDKESPIVKGMADWTTINEELYNNINILTAHALVKGKQTYDDKKSGKHVENETVVVWTNEFGPNKTRIFSTTIGHNNETVGDARYLNLVTNGLLWAAGKLGEDGKVAAGYEAVKK